MGSDAEPGSWLGVMSDAEPGSWLGVVNDAESDHSCLGVVSDDAEPDHSWLGDLEARTSITINSSTTVTRTTHQHRSRASIILASVAPQARNTIRGEVE